MSRDSATIAVGPAFARILLAGLALSALTVRVGGEESDAIVITTRPELKALHFEPLNIVLDAHYRYSQDRLRRSDGQTVRDREHLFRQTLTLSTTGFAGHPNLFSFDLSGSLQLSQQDLKTESGESRWNNDETIGAYDITGYFLRESPTPLTAYTRRTQTLVGRPFADTLENIVTEHGVMLRLRALAAPTSLQYFRREQEQRSLSGPADFELVQDTFRLQSQLLASSDHLLTVDYSYDNVEERGRLRPTNAFERHDATVRHRYSFGEPRHPSNLRSTLRYFNESGRSSIERVRWDQALELRHTPNFDTRYSYIFDRQDRLNAEQTLHRGMAGFRHRLFDSLVTTGNVGASRLELPDNDFRSDQLFADLAANYTKTVPYGRLLASAGVNYAQQWDSERGSPIQITGEVRQFDIAGRILLTRRHIVLGSIVVRDAGGLITYMRGTDYTVQAIGEAVEIRLVLGGDIPPGATVLIDYSIGPEPAGETTTTGASVTARYQLEEGELAGLGVFARYLHQEQDRSSSGRAVLGDDHVRDLTFGADYERDRIRLLAEHQIRQGTLSPFEATRLQASYIDALAPGSAFVLTATYDQVNFSDADLITRVTTASARLTQQLTNRLSGRARVLFRYETESRGPDVRAYEQELDLTWQYRQTTVYGSFRNVILDSSMDDSMFQTIMIGLRREF